MTSSLHIIASRSGASSTKAAQRSIGMMQGRQCHWCQKHQPAVSGRRV